MNSWSSELGESWGRWKTQAKASSYVVDGDKGKGSVLGESNINSVCSGEKTFIVIKVFPII